jgi:hypothetical protein
MVFWCSLFLPCDDAKVVASTLQESLRELEYTPFNPFGLMPGLSYPHAVRLFVAPAQRGWVRVVGEPDYAQLSMISQATLCLLVALNGTEARIEAYADGEQKPPETALLSHLKSGTNAEMLHEALLTKTASQPTQSSNMELLRDALPEAVKAMRVDTRQAQNMFDRLSAGLTRRSGNAGNELAVRSLLQSDRPDWNSAGGVQIRVLMDCLTIPPGWQEPDFVTLRDAYQLHGRRRRNPNVTLYPGDAEAMAAVPDALDYIVVYAGKGCA